MWVSCPGFLLHHSALLVKEELSLLETPAAVAVHHGKSRAAAMSYIQKRMEMQLWIPGSGQDAGLNGNISGLG